MEKYIGWHDLVLVCLNDFFFIFYFIHVAIASEEISGELCG